jgi:long-chain acyl-CoA synthetase
MSTVPQLLLDRAARDQGGTSFFARTSHVAWEGQARSAQHPGWTELSMSDLVEVVSSLAEQLATLGVQKGCRVAVLSETSSMWAALDMAIISLGGVTVGIYPTLPADQVLWLLKHSEAHLLICENVEQWSRLGDLSQLKDLEHTRLIWPSETGPPRIAPAEPNLDFLHQSISKLLPDDICTIVYTSGTTGEPKGAMLTHANFVSVIHASVDVIPTQAGDRSIVFLPMAHSLQRFALYRGLAEEVVGYFCTIEDLPETLRIARPHVLVSVPRMLEKVQAQVRAGAKAKGPRAVAFLERAIADGEQAAELRRLGQRLPLNLRTRLAFAERLVYRRIRQGLGGSLHTFISGGAALSPQLARWFEAVGIEVLEGWGLTETSAPATATPAGAARHGSVGPPLPGVTIRTMNDGELLVESPGNFQGYFKDPEATAQAFTSDGAFRTGDLGRIDADGYVWITGRKKAIIVTAGGKNIAPVPIEKRLERDLIGQAVVVGSERPYLVALLALDPDLLEAEARQKGWSGGTAEWRQRAEVIRRVQSVIDDANQGRASFETVKKFAILPRSLSLEEKELTPTLKLRRAIVLDHFQDQVDSLYSTSSKEN